MSREKFIDRNFRQASLSLIDSINTVLDENPDRRPILRALYYQLVVMNIIPNTIKEYEHLSRLLTDARMAGLVDLDAIEDRHRSWDRRTRWESPAAIVDAAVRGFHMDMWENQLTRPFVVVEKDSLVDVLEGVCNEYDVPLLAAKGYPSATVMKEFSTDDILPALDEGQAVVILHLGDHDPSGLDMSRDIEERIRIFTQNGGGEHDIQLRLPHYAPADL